ncbi:MAG: flagellar basal body P-ring formation protein FlgA [Candidatus Marinimicrobia bacterium]|nr:flagellar basal body P-ring formation protein FlgA [Candidatus Neomarinimicrobiota bacterium]
MNSKVTISLDVVRMMNDVGRGEIVRREDVTLDQIRSDRILREAPVRLDKVVGREATRNLKSGRIVKRRDTKKAPLVNRGDRVMIVVRRGGLKITAPGTVREEGFKNSIVQVVNLNSKKMVYGEVIDANTVEVKF